MREMARGKQGGVERLSALNEKRQPLISGASAEKPNVVVVNNMSAFDSTSWRSQLASNSGGICVAYAMKAYTYAQSSPGGRPKPQARNGIKRAWRKPYSTMTALVMRRVTQPSSSGNINRGVLVSNDINNNVVA